MDSQVSDYCDRKDLETIWLRPPGRNAPENAQREHYKDSQNNHLLNLPDYVIKRKKMKKTFLDKKRDSETDLKYPSLIYKAWYPSLLTCIFFQVTSSIQFELPRMRFPEKMMHIFTKDIWEDLIGGDNIKDLLAFFKDKNTDDMYRIFIANESWLPLKKWYEEYRLKGRGKKNHEEYLFVYSNYHACLWPSKLFDEVFGDEFITKVNDRFEAILKNINKENHPVGAKRKLSEEHACADDHDSFFTPKKCPIPVLTDAPPAPVKNNGNTCDQFLHSTPVPYLCLEEFGSPLLGNQSMLCDDVGTLEYGNGISSDSILDRREYDPWCEQDFNAVFHADMDKTSWCESDLIERLLLANTHTFANKDYANSFEREKARFFKDSRVDIRAFEDWLFRLIPTGMEYKDDSDKYKWLSKQLEVIKYTQCAPFGSPNNKENIFECSKSLSFFGF